MHAIMGNPSRNPSESESETESEIETTDTKGAAEGSFLSRTLHLDDRRTTLRMESEMWAALHEICEREDMRVNELCRQIDRRRQPPATLTSAVRVFVLSYFREALGAHERPTRRAGGQRRTSAADRARSQS